VPRYYATGWQPGTELFEHIREKFMMDFARQHQMRGSPLHKTTPQEALNAVGAEFGVRDKTLFKLHSVSDTSGCLSFIVEEVQSGGTVQLPQTGAGVAWELFGGHDANGAYVSDGVNWLPVPPMFASEPLPTASNVAGGSPAIATVAGGSPMSAIATVAGGPPPMSPPSRRLLQALAAM